MANVIRVGDIEIHRIVEQQAPFFDMYQFFPKLTPDLLDANRSWLEPRYVEPVTNKLILCIQSYVVRTPHHTILVDSCVGNDKPRPNRPMWDRMQGTRYHEQLAALGLGVGVGSIEADGGRVFRRAWGCTSTPSRAWSH